MTKIHHQYQIIRSVLGVFFLIFYSEQGNANQTKTQFSPPPFSERESPFLRQLPSADQLTNTGFSSNNDQPASPFRNQHRHLALQRWHLAGTAQHYISDASAVTIVNKAPATQPAVEKIYVRLGSQNSEAAASTFAQQLYQNMQGWLISPIKIHRHKAQSYTIELGPFSTAQHADSYCQFIRKKAAYLAASCTALKIPMRAADDNPNPSSALFVNSMGNGTAQRQILSEGEHLAGTDLILIKVGDDGVLLANGAGRLITVSSSARPQQHSFEH